MGIDLSVIWFVIIVFATLMYIVSGIIPNVNYGELTGEVLVGGEEILGRKMGYICRKTRTSRSCRRSWRMKSRSAVKISLFRPRR